MNVNTAEKFVIALYRSLNPQHKRQVDAALGLARRQPPDRLTSTLNLGHTSGYWLVHFNSACEAVFGRPTQGGAR